MRVGVCVCAPGVQRCNNEPSLLMTWYANRLSIYCRFVSISQGFLVVSSTSLWLDSMIFVSFIYLFIQSALLLWFSEPAGYFVLMNALYSSFVRVSNWTFQSKLSHWRWWFSWGEQTQAALWLFINLARSRGSRLQENYTTGRKNSTLSVSHNIFCILISIHISHCLCC